MFANNTEKKFSLCKIYKYFSKLFLISLLRLAFIHYVIYYIKTIYLEKLNYFLCVKSVGSGGALGLHQKARQKNRENLRNLAFSSIFSCT